MRPPVRSGSASSHSKINNEPFRPLRRSFFVRVYLKSRKYSLFLQTQPDFALKSLEIHKGFLRLFALNPACVCEISVIFFVFRHTLGTIEAVAVGGEVGGGGLGGSCIRHSGAGDALVNESLFQYLGADGG